MLSSLLVGGSPGREYWKGVLGGNSGREFWEEVLGRDISSGIQGTHELDTTIAKFAMSYSSKKDSKQTKEKSGQGRSTSALAAKLCVRVIFYELDPITAKCLFWPIPHKRMVTNVFKRKRMCVVVHRHR